MGGFVTFYILRNNIQCIMMFDVILDCINARRLVKMSKALII